MTTQPQRGHHIALMGIDGAGKTTIALELGRSLGERGVTSEVLSWKRVMRGQDPFAARVLGHTSLLSYKCQYAHATPADATDVQSLLAGDSVEAFFPEIERKLQTMRIERNEPDLLVCSALLEFAGNVALYRTYVQTALRAGRTLIEESYGFKHVLKNVLMVKRCAPPDSPVRRIAQDILEAAHHAFGVLVRPTHGYWIDTDPELALRWRQAGHDVITTFEDYGLVGERGEASFLALQSDCRHFFGLAARDWEWGRISMLDRPSEENTREAVAAIERDLFGPKPLRVP